MLCPNTVLQMSGGRTIVRALRGFVLIDGALTVLLLQQLISEVFNNECPNSEKLTAEKINELTNLYGSLLDRSPENIDAVSLKCKRLSLCANMIC